MSVQTVVVCGLVGKDEVLLLNEPLIPGRKVWGERIDAFGYFGLNVAFHLLSGGISVTLVTALGDDEVGEKIESWLQGLGITWLQCEWRVSGLPSQPSLWRTGYAWWCEPKAVSHNAGG